MRLGGRALPCLLVPGLLLLATLNARLPARGRGGEPRLEAEDTESSVDTISGDSVSVEWGGGEAARPSTPRQPELHELEARYRARRELAAAACLQHRPELEGRYRALWPDHSWEQALAQADVLEKTDRGLLWCKVHCTALHCTALHAVVQGTQGGLGELDRPVRPAVVREEEPAAHVETAGAGRAWALHCTALRCTADWLRADAKVALLGFLPAPPVCQVVTCPPFC